MLLNQTIYYLNKSKSKWISVGLYYPFEFASVVKIFGRSKQYVIFKEEEWIQFHEQRENINKYFDTMWKPRQIGSKTLTFEMIEEKKILKIEDMCGNEVYLGWKSVSEVWSLESVLRYRLSYSSGSNFKYFYEDVIRAVAEMSGDVKINIYNIINRLSEKSDDVCCMLEVLLFMPEKALFDVQLERRIQEQGQKRVKKHLLKKMWMLYAQEHWTKSYDFKSAVERLYEELGALEFDADHEAIYGMERYYTVQQCEELRDKYKIGRKVCRKFLQGRTCSQCLVKRISEIGLRHFLDTVNKYIKDCSDSSSSSDEEVFKAVEQNGEETTEEEEESKKSESESVTKHNLLITFKYYLLPPAQDLYTYIKTDRSERHLNIYNSCIVVNNFIKTMDSIPTSCVQLAKEQIIKYSDPKYNINDLKTGDCETMLLNQTIYYLNKSKSKWIGVGLYYPFEFASVVKIFGRSKQYVIFKEEEWIQFHEQRENINKYFQTFDTMWKPRQIGSKT
ncbi:hypothetical protein FQA39_LY18641 [Lamprigera yunnana]|nr:hypothetical protein FQA39_LY18641 [Lamprigera yunnana]